jgi:hypothetical protein
MVFTMLLLHAHPLPSNCCVILATRHTLLLRGRLATVVNKHHIAYSMHVTLWYPSSYFQTHGNYRKGAMKRKLLHLSFSQWWLWMGCNSTQSGKSSPIFQMNVLSASSGSKSKPSTKSTRNRQQAELYSSKKKLAVRELQSNQDILYFDVFQTWSVNILFLSKRGKHLEDGKIAETCRLKW